MDQPRARKNHQTERCSSEHFFYAIARKPDAGQLQLGGFRLFSSCTEKGFRWGCNHETGFSPLVVVHGIGGCSAGWPSFPLSEHTGSGIGNRRLHMRVGIAGAVLGRP